MQGALLAHESEENKADFKELSDRQEKNDRLRINKENKLEVLTARKGNISLDRFRGKYVFVEKEICDADLRATLASKGMMRSGVRVGSDAFIVPNPADPGMRVMWAAVLTGASIMNRDAVQGKGYLMQFKPALVTKRDIWVSTSFRAHRPTVFEIVRSCAEQTSGSKWYVHDDGSDANFRRLKIRIKNGGGLSGLVTEAEVKACICF